MIDERRFSNERTLRLFYGERVRRYTSDLVQRTQNKLKIVYAASRLEDPAVPPGNRLEALKGDRRGQWSIRVNVNGASASSGTVREPWRSKSWTITEWA